MYVCGLRHYIHILHIDHTCQTHSVITVHVAHMCSKSPAGKQCILHFPECSGGDPEGSLLICISDLMSLAWSFDKDMDLNG